MIKGYLGNSTPLKVFEAVHKVELTYNSNFLVYDGPERGNLNGNQLQILIENITQLLKETQTNHLVLLLSASSKEIRVFKEYQNYLDAVYLSLHDKEGFLASELIYATGGINREIEQKVIDRYAEIEQKLNKVVSTLSGED